jgi:hypothetical protein
MEEQPEVKPKSWGSQVRDVLPEAIAAWGYHLDILVKNRQNCKPFMELQRLMEEKSK